MKDLIFQHDGLVFEYAEGQFGLLKDFLYTCAQGIAKEYSDVVDFHAKQQKELPKVVLDDLYNDDYFDVYLEDLSEHGNTFPRLLLYSAMIMAVSLFESNMKLVFESMNHFNQTDLNWYKLRGNVVDKTAELLKVINLRTKDEKGYLREFRNFYMVRNCIVHDNGIIDSGKTKLLEYAKRTGLLSEDDPENILELKRSYCEGVCDSFEFFFSDLSISYIK